MHRIHTVYVDMDGVLVDFIGGVLSFLGRHPSDADRLTPMKWEIWEDMGIPEVDFWEILNSSTFWSDLEWMPDGEEIIKTLESFWPKEQIYLLTSPGKDFGMGAQGKSEWVRWNLPDYTRRMIPTDHKHLLSKPGCLLIDDNMKHVEEWMCRGEGPHGVAITRPARCNQLHSVASTPFVPTLKGWIERNCVVVRGLDVLESMRKEAKRAGVPFEKPPVQHPSRGGPLSTQSEIAERLYREAREKREQNG